ncbi:MAG: sigma 54-interacting transcriptional regulator [Bacillota bacterium]
MFIETLKDRCHECYACVRNCPVKAIKVISGQAEVVEERCIFCGKCVEVCSQGAKRIISEERQVEKWLNDNEAVSVGLAPSFPAFKKEWLYSDWEKYLYSFGFAEIYEVSLGAELIKNQYRNLLQNTEKTIISSTCPVIVSLIEKYYPELIENLGEIFSPMQALSKYFKNIKDKDSKLVLVGPCHAKKNEFKDDGSTAVLTFSELFSLGGKLNINLNDTGNYSKKDKLHSYEVDENSTEISEEARNLPIAGNLLKAVDSSSKKYINVEGENHVVELLDLLLEKEISPEFVDILFCEGCIDGVDLKDGNYYSKKLAVENYTERFRYFSRYNMEAAENLDLSREFSEKKIPINTPDDSEIWEVLNKTGKYTEDDLLDCGACGYKSCWDKAAAVCEGMAEVNMCLPYLLSEKRTEVKEEQEVNKELDLIINSSYDGIMVVNRDGKVEQINEAYLKMLNMEKKDLLRKPVSELEKKRILYPSVSLLSINEKKEMTIVQNTHTGKRLLVTANPVINSGILEKIIINARDLKELNQVIEKTDYKNEDIPGHIISRSEEMKNILKLSQKIAETDSTILITGESGVGKEVVAKYIHEQSTEREKFVKINCAAIPETLLESELFGYEKGAFSGARKEGKPGLIEEADQGTLFLDEIGELPLNMQAKLLQVLQEHRVSRIGGVESKKVNFRLIAATNRDLHKMVKNKEFREDLFYRLNVVPIMIPPLKSRKEDIIPLIKHFTSILNEKYGKNIHFSQESLDYLLRYDWPGNVRELNNILERLILTAEESLIDKENIKKLINIKDQKNKIDVKEILPLTEAVEEVEKKILMLAKENERSTYEMAELLGVNQSTVVRKLKKYFG